MSWFEINEFSDLWEICLKFWVIILISLFIDLMCDDYSWMSIICCIDFLSFRVFNFWIMPLNSNVSIMLFFNLKFKEKRLTFEHFDSLELVTIPKYTVANIYTLEAFHKLFKGHSKVTIVYCSTIWSCLRSKLLNHLGIDSVPKFFIILTCESWVLCFSPRISQPHNTIHFIITLDILTV